MLEEQMQLNTTDRQLLFDIRSEMRKTNDQLAQLLGALRPIAKDTVNKEAKLKEKKEAKINESLSKSSRSDTDSSTGSPSPRHPSKRKTVHDKQHGSTTSVLQSDSDSNGGKRVSRSSRTSSAAKVHSEK